jgi:hypothetical protein
MENGQETLTEKMARLRAKSGVVGSPTLSQNDTAGAMDSSNVLPHDVVVADGVRGPKDGGDTVIWGTTAAAPEVESHLVSDGQSVHSESDFVKELQSMHDEIEKLTKEYTEGGLQVSDFPASYHNLTNRYRIRASQLNKRVGSPGKEESKVQREIEEMQLKMQQRLEEARRKDAEAEEERKKAK